MNHRKNKKNNMILLLLVLLGSLGIGYALISTNLTINGVGKFNNQNWNVHFEDLTLNPNNVTLSSGDVAATIDQTTMTEITFTVTLQKPGDFYEFEVAAVNSGTMDAMIGLITNNLNNSPIGAENEVPAFARYTATYSDGVSIAPNHLLEAGYSENFKVRLEYRTDIDPEDLPDTVQTLTFNFGVEYVQANSTAITRPTSLSGTRYTVDRYSNDVYVSLNQAVPNGITLYQTQQEALAAIKTASTKDLPFYLKHTIANDIVTESYVEVLIDNITKQNIITLACNSDSTCETKVNAIPNGTYTLRGAGSTYDETLDEYSISPYYATNKAVIESMFGTGCAEEYQPGTSSAIFRCSARSFTVSAYADGNVFVGVTGGNCGVGPGGGSSCHWA